MGGLLPFQIRKASTVSLVREAPPGVDPLSRMVIAPYPSRYRKTLAFSEIPDAGSSSLSLAAPESPNLISRAGFPIGRSIPIP